MPTLLIRNATLIDGTGAEPVPNAALLVEGNRISAVGPEGEIAPPAGALEIDAAGGTILPGFIDTHVHVMMEGLDLVSTMTAPFSLRFFRAVDHLRRTLDAGITSVRDAGGADLGVKTAVERGLIDGPRMQISVSVLTITGGHGDGWMPSGMELALFPAYPGVPDGRCDGPEQVRRTVREVLRAGADVIKICSTGGVLSPTDHPEYTQFDPEELAVIVQEGRYRRGIKVMAHAQGAEGIKNAVRAGVHSIEHGIYLDDEALDLMLQHGTFLVPTLVAPLGVLEAAERDGSMPPYGVQKAREVVDAHRDSIRRAHAAGVKIAMGTDAAVVPHGTNLRELGLMVECGMTPMEAIVASTSTAAECLGWHDRLGTLAPGMLADIVVCRTDPLADIRSLENRDNIAVVIKDGRTVKHLLAEPVGAVTQI